MATGNQGEHFQRFCSKAQLPVCSGLGRCRPGRAPGGHGRAGASSTGHSGFIARGKSSERFPAVALPALDCRCCCLITASSPASPLRQGSGLPGSPEQVGIIPSSVFTSHNCFPPCCSPPPPPPPLPRSSSSCAGLVLGCQCSGARAGA